MDPHVHFDARDEGRPEQRPRAAENRPAAGGRRQDDRRPPRRAGGGRRDGQPDQAANAQRGRPGRSPRRDQRDGAREPAPAVDARAVAVVPDNREVYRVPWTLTSKAMDYLNVHFPSFRFETISQSVHGHPTAAVERSLVELLMYRMLHSMRCAEPYMDGRVDPDLSAERKAEQAAHRVVQGAPWIHDIGGSPMRHHSQQRPNVWCSAPRRGGVEPGPEVPLDPADVLRQDKWVAKIPPADRRWCDERCQECLVRGGAAAMVGVGFAPHVYHGVTVTADYGMSVQSLYYLPAPTANVAEFCLIDIVHNITSKKLLASVHEFADAYGSMYFADNHPEARYEVHNDGFVSMTVEGNHGGYRHSALGWLYNTSSAMKVAADGTRRSLTWERVAKYGHTHVWKFVGVTDAVAVVPVVQLNFQEVIRANNYYGPVAPLGDRGAAGPILDRARLEVVAVFDRVDVVSQAVYSYGPFVIFGGSHSTVTPISKAVINELGAYMIEKQRNPDTYRALKLKAKDVVSKLRMPDDVRARCAVTAAAIAFTVDMEYEMSLIQSYIVPNEVRMNAYNDMNKNLGKLGWMAWAGIKHRFVSKRILYPAILASGCIASAFYAYSYGRSRVPASRPLTISEHLKGIASVAVHRAVTYYKRAPASSQWWRTTDMQWWPAAGNVVVDATPARVLSVARAIMSPARALVVLSSRAERLQAYQLLVDPIRTVVAVAILGPLVEEALKRIMAATVTIAAPRVTAPQATVLASAAFAAFEHLALGRSLLVSMLPATMHVIAGTLPMPFAVALHSAYNAICLVHCAAAGVVALGEQGEPYTSMTYRVSTYGLDAAFGPCGIVQCVRHRLSAAHVGAVAVVVLAGACVVWFLAARGARSAVVRGLPPAFEHYRHSYATVPPAVPTVYVHEVHELPSYTCLAPIADITSRAKLTPSSEVRVHCPGFFAAGAALLVSIPMVPGSNPHNELMALSNRQLCMNPNEKERLYPVVTTKGIEFEEYDEVAFTGYETFMEYYMADLYPLDDLRANPTWYFHDGRLQPMPLEAWLARFPLATRTALKQGHVRYKEHDSAVRRMYGVKGFIKTEALLGSTLHGCDWKIPRFIASSQPELNVVTGPSVVSASKISASIWNPSFFMMYATGLTCEEFGAWRDRTIELFPDGLDVEIDYDRFDATIHERFQDVERSRYAHYGMRSVTLAHLEASVGCHGHTRHGHKFSIPYRRRSGTAETSDGNTGITGSVDVYDHACRFGLIDRSAMERRIISLNAVAPGALRPAISKLLVGAALGDDNLTRINMIAVRAWGAMRGLARFADVCEALRADIVAERRRLGLRPVPVVRIEIDDAEICSGLFWPTDAGRVFGPKPGRACAKFGYYVNPPAPKAIMAIVRGDAMGRLNDSGHIPVFGALVKRVVDVVGAGPRILPRQYEQRFHVEKRHEASEATVDMFCRRYSCTREDIADAERLIGTIPSVPCSYYHPLLAVMVERDTGLLVTA